MDRDVSQELRIVGGAKVGWVNASWPFGRLIASPEKITLNATLIGKYEFSATEVVSIEEYGLIPLIGRGIRIVHNRTDCPQKVVFWCFGNPHSTIEKIKKIGFAPRGMISAETAQRGFPIRWQAILFLILYWNLLLGKDMFAGGEMSSEPGILTFTALLTFFLISSLIWKVEFIEKAIMVPGHKPAEIRSFLYLLALVTGAMSFFIGLIVLGSRV